MIDCREAVRRMWTYLDDSLERGPTEELDEHLASCRRCCGELEFSRHLRELVATPRSEPLPDPLRRQLDALLAGGGVSATDGDES